MTNASYGTWRDPDGDTASPKGPTWTLEQPHDKQEDAILEKIDAQRGHYPVRCMSAEKAGLKGVRVRVVADAALRAALDKFVERLVHIMIGAHEDGAGSATRAYVIAREMQIIFRGDQKYEVHVSPEGARALATELAAYLPANPTPATAVLFELQEAVGRTLSARRQARRRR